MQQPSEECNESLPPINSPSRGTVWPREEDVIMEDSQEDEQEEQRPEEQSEFVARRAGALSRLLQTYYMR